MRLSSSPHLPSPSNHSLLNSSSSSSSADDASADDRIDDLDLLDDDQNPLTPPADAAPQGLFWDHALGVARISFDGAATASPIPDDFVRPDLAFGSDDEPADEAVRAKLASIRRVEDVLLIGDSPMRDGWAKWLEGKGDFIRKDRMLRSSNHEMLNPRNHPLLQDPDVAGLTGMTRGDRMMRKAVLREVVEADSGGLREKGMEGRRRSLREKRDEGSGFLGVDLGLGFSEFVDRFFDGGLCSLRVFMVWNTPSWSFGVRHRRGVESLFYHHRNACVLVFSETVEQDFFKEFVKDG